MCNIVAIAGSTNTDVTLEQLVQQCFLLEPAKTFRNVEMFRESLDNLLGIEVAEGKLRFTLDRLVEQGRLTRLEGAYVMPMQIRAKLQVTAQGVEDLETKVREEWLEEVAVQHSNLDSGTAWLTLKAFLARVFRRHGVQAVRLLDPGYENSEEHEKSLGALLDEALTLHTRGDCNEDCRRAITSFLANIQYHPERAKYIAQLADTAFNYFSLAIPPEVSSSFRRRLENLVIFFDTNVLYGLLDLNVDHRPIATRLVLAVNQNRLPFRLRYHEATDQELRYSISSQASRLKNKFYPQHISAAAASSGRIGGVPLRYHQRNAQTAVSVVDFLQRFEHPDVLLKSDNLDIYRPSGVPETHLKRTEHEYQAYLDECGKEKTTDEIKHDAVVLATAYHVREQQRQSSSIAVGALMVTLDQTLYRFDQRFSRDINFEPVAVMPEAFLQVLRPYLDAKHDYDTAFAQAFAFPEFRTISGRASEAANKVLSIMAAYEGIPEEVAARLLSNRILLERVGNDQTDEELREAFEQALGEETGALAREASSLRGELENVTAEREKERAKTQEVEKNAANSERKLLAEIEAERVARARDAEKLKREREAAQRLHEEELAIAQQQAASQTNALEGRLSALEVAKEEMTTRLDEKDRRAFRLRAALILIIALLIIVVLLWAAHFGPLKGLQRHTNAWTIEGTVSFIIFVAALGFAIPKWRAQAWVGVGVGAVLVLIQALGGPSSLPTEILHSPK